MKFNQADSARQQKLKFKSEYIFQMLSRIKKIIEVFTILESSYSD